MTEHVLKVIIAIVVLVVVAQLLIQSLNKIDMAKITEPIGIIWLLVFIVMMALLIYVISFLMRM